MRQIGSHSGHARQSRTGLRKVSPGLGATHSRAGGTPWGRQKLRRYAPLLRLCSSRVPSAAPLTTKSSSGLQTVGKSAELLSQECDCHHSEPDQGTRVCSAALHAASQASPQGMRCNPTNGRAGRTRRPHRSLGPGAQTTRSAAAVAAAVAAAHAPLHRMRAMAQVRQLGAHMLVCTSQVQPTSGAAQPAAGRIAARLQLQAGTASIS